MDGIDWIGMAQKVGIAIVIIIVTWILAQVVKWAIGKLVGRLSFLQRQGSDGNSLGESLGRVGSLLVWLFGLIAVLQVFALQAVLTPIQGLLNTVMAYLPSVLGAAFLFFIGFVIAKVVKQLIEVAIGMVNFQGIAAKVKKVDPTGSTPAGSGQHSGEYPAPTGEYGQAPGAAPGAVPSGGLDSRRIGSIVGNVVFAIIMITVAIGALQVLGIEAISAPAQQMLNLILNTIPAIIAALLLLAIGYVIAKFVGSLLESTLRGIGTDRAVAGAGIVREDQSASRIITRIVQVAIMVFFAIMAARALHFDTITNILDEVLSLGGRVLFGGVIIAVGFLVAKLLANAAGSGTASTVVRYATLALFVAMGLKYMGIADSIITLAFGSVVVGGALAAALAFGLGGRDAAARTLSDLRGKRDSASS